MAVKLKGHKKSKHRPADTLDYIRQHFSSPPSFEDLLDRAWSARESSDPDALFEAAAQMLNRFPEVVETYLIVAEGSLTLGYMALYVHTQRTLWQRWPDHQASWSQATLERAEAALVGDQRTPLETMVQHDWMQWHLRQGRADLAREVALKVLGTSPHDLPTLNNLSLAQLELGSWPEAVHTLQQVLQLCPDNEFAMATLVIAHVRAGRIQEAQEFAVGLKALRRDGLFRWTKVAEALSYLGDDAGVLEIHRLASETDDGILEHFAAVAWARQGDWKRAKKLWKASAQKGLSLAQDNLRNADLPAGRRHSPWAFNLGNWLDLRKLPKFQDLPELEELVPLLLDRGDPVGTELALRLAGGSQNARLLESLRVFALSQRGRDDFRFDAARICREAGLLPARVQLWQKGKWGDFVLLAFSLNWEEGEKLPKLPEGVCSPGACTSRQLWLDIHHLIYYSAGGLTIGEKPRQPLHQMPQKRPPRPPQNHRHRPARRICLSKFSGSRINPFGKDIRQERTLDIAFWLDLWCGWRGGDSRYFQARDALTEPLVLKSCA